MADFAKVGSIQNVLYRVSAIFSLHYIKYSTKKNIK